MRKLICFFLLMFSLHAYAQKTEVARQANTTPNIKNEKTEMADVFREDGKIYVVVAVILIIFLGVLFYIFTLEKKISRIEKEINSKQ